MRNVGTSEPSGHSRLRSSAVPAFFTFLTFPTFLTFRPFLTFLRSLAGMPDYERHVEHLSRCHPEIPIPSARAYYEEFVRARYGDGPTRCC